MPIKLLPEEVDDVRHWLERDLREIKCPWYLRDGTCASFNHLRCHRLFPSIPVPVTSRKCPCKVFGSAYVSRRAKKWLRDFEEENNDGR